MKQDSILSKKKQLINHVLHERDNIMRIKSAHLMMVIENDLYNTMALDITYDLENQIKHKLNKV